jgi:hypothetical protein
VGAQGPVGANGIFQLNVVSVSGGTQTYNVGATDDYIRANPNVAATITVNLPDAGGAIGRVITVKNVGLGTVSVGLQDVMDSIDGNSSVLLAPGQSLTVIAGDVNSWDVIALT